MSIFVFSNNVNTILANTANSAATTLTLTSGANLPTLLPGQVMPLTLNDAATGLVYEVVYVTAISGVSLTVIRGQEGTVAQNWNVGDYALCAPTGQTVQPIIGTIQPTVSGVLPAGNDVVVFPGTLSGAIALTLPASPLAGSKYTIYGSSSAFPVTVQTSVTSGSPFMGFPGAANAYSYVIPASSPMVGIVCIWAGTNWRCSLISTAPALPPWYAADTGAANAYAATYSPAVTTLTDGLYLAFEAAHANTGASTFSANGTAYPILAENTLAALQGGEIVQYGKCVIMWSAHYASWILYAGGGGLPVADATQSRHALNRETGDARYAALAGLASQLFSAANGTSGNQVVNISQFSGLFNVPGYVILPNGLIIQWGYISVPQGLTNFSFPITFPNGAFGLWLSLGQAIISAHQYALGGDAISASQFCIANDNALSGSTQGTHFLAIGY
jgi:hypothetical protein